MSKLIDIKGQKFGRLTVLERAENASTGQAQQLCECECGNKIVVKGQQLRSGHTQSCGCLRKDKTKEYFLKSYDLTGQKFGHLTVLKRTEKRDNNRVIYLCQCDCGNKVEIRGDRLTRGEIVSCGCVNSKGEERISKILRENNIPFEMQKTFDDCRNPETDSLFRFDFYINNQYLLEYDGIQHFLYDDNSIWNTKENLEKTQKYDTIKNQYCKDHNIPLIRIPYTKYDTLCLEDLLLETSKYILK